MYICEEYYFRKNLSIPSIKYVDLGFIFFNKNKILKIEWEKNKPRPGIYNISECFLEKTIKTTKRHEVSWSEYEFFLKDWIRDKEFIVDKNQIFILLWNYFLRRYESFFAENYDPFQIYETLEGENKITNALDLLDSIYQENKTVYDFWDLKINEILHNYCYWLPKIGSDLV